MKLKGGHEMRKVTVIILVLGVILSLQSCAMSEKKLPEPEGVLLSHSDLEKLFSNKTTFIVSTNKSEVDTKQTSYPGGTCNYTWKAHGEKGEGYGTYRIINGQKCISWENILNGKEKCWNVYKINDDKLYIECTDGTEFGYVTQVREL